MTEIGWFAIFFSAVFTNNILLTNYLGMCSFLGASKNVKTALGLGSAVIFVMTFTSVLNWLVYHHVLVRLDLVYLRFIVFIIVIAAFVQIVEMIIERVSEALYAALGLAASFAYGLGSGVGWAVAILAMAGIREKTARSRIPRGLEGAGITLIIAGIMALAFMGFNGMINLN